MVRTSKYRKIFFYQNFQTKMSNSATLTNEIKQSLATISNSLTNVHYMIQHAISCHDTKYTETVLHNIQEASDFAEAINTNAGELASAFATLRRKVIFLTCGPSGHDDIDDNDGWSERTEKYEKDGAKIWIDPANGRTRITGPIPADVGAKLKREAKERLKVLMETSMTKELPPTTPTRRIKPTVCPPAPKKSKWRAGNRYSALASSSNEVRSSRSSSPPTPPNNGRRGGRPCTPGCCAPPTPQLTSVASPTLDWVEYDPVPDALDLDDYDMWGRKIHYDLF